MLDYSGNDQKAKLVALHYADQFGDPKIIAIVDNEQDVKSAEDAILLAKFYWEMLDTSAEDRDNGVEVLGERDLQFWMERLFSIIGGHISNIGYEAEWNRVCHEV